MPAPEQLARLETSRARGRGALPQRPRRRCPQARSKAADAARQGGQCASSRRSSSNARSSRPRSRAMPRRPAPHGIDRVEFWVQTNPGTRPGPLMKVASGGELARFLLALKVVLADRGSAPTLVFDEIDTGVGGAVADAIGVRLARLAERRAGDRGHPCAAGRGARRPPLPHHQGRARQGQAGRDARHRSRGRAPPRGDRPHAGGRRDHRRSARGGRAADQGGAG